jgi:NAD(P)-dependent dehydrogenase (short-subunit alcohol dehydrogenase family)
VGLLDGKVGIVTGGGAGIGRATALLFAREGAKVAIAERDRNAGVKVAAEIAKSGGEAIYIETDVSRPSDVQAMVDRTVAEYGGLHCVSNNAAVGSGYARMAELDEKTWDQTMAVTLKGVWLCMRAEIPAMLRCGGGSIVNIGSVSGMKGEAFLAGYSAAKGGVIALSKSAASEYAEQGIRVNVVCPGGIATDGMTDYLSRAPEVRERTVNAHAMKRLGTPGEIAEAVGWLCSDRSSFTTGHVMVVDGGTLVKSHAM